MLEGKSNKKLIEAENKKGSWNIKLIVEKLLTIERLKIRKPNIYGLITNCSRCEEEKEDFKHIWKCKKNKVKVEDFIEQMLQILK